MQLPNKLYSYSNSIISKFPVVLRTLQNGEVQILTLFLKNQDRFDSINDFIETLDALYALRKIEYDAQKGVIQLVV